MIQETKPLHAPAPSVRLAALESVGLDTAADVQSAYFALTRLLREAVDLRLGQLRSGLTDEEWRTIVRAKIAGSDIEPEDWDTL